MKVIRTDNYGRDEIADDYIMGFLTDAEADELVEVLNRVNHDDHWWYKSVANDYRLSRGMADLV